MAAIKAVIFDLDGTLRDTKKIIYDAYHLALQTHAGKVPTETELLPHIHHHSQVHTAFVPNVPLELFEETYFGKIHQTISRAKPYAMAHEIAEVLKKEGYRLAIVTSASFGTGYLKQHNVDHLFEVIVGGQDTKRQKPHPDPVLRALDKLDIKASEAIMVGDMTVDVQAARAAQLTAVIGITHGFETREMLEKAGADFIIDSFKELPAIVEKLNSKV